MSLSIPDRGPGQAHERWYLALLGFAEHYRINGDINLCVHCLQAIFQFQPSPRIEARTHLQIATVLYKYTENMELPIMYAQKAVALSCQIPSFEEVYYESNSLLSDILVKSGNTAASRQLLTSILGTQQKLTCYWFTRFSLQMATVLLTDQEYDLAILHLTQGANYAEIQQSHLAHVNLLLAQGLIMLKSQKYNLVEGVFSKAGSLIPNLGMVPKIDKEAVMCTFLCLQVCHLLNVSQLSTVKTPLRDLQNSLQQFFHLDSDVQNGICQFTWISVPELCVVVYLLTSMFCMYSGEMTNVIKFSDKGLNQVMECAARGTNTKLLQSLKVILLEVSCQTQLMIGQKHPALQNIKGILQEFRISHDLSVNHSAQIHCLLGLYAMLMNQMDLSERHFGVTLSVTKNPDLWIFAAMNLGMIYLRDMQNRFQDLQAISQRLEPSNLRCTSNSIKTGCCLLKGYILFHMRRYPEAKVWLREGLNQANAGEFTRLISFSLTLLSYLFLTFGNVEALQMAKSAASMADSLNDASLRLWTCAILRDAYKLAQNPAAEAEFCSKHVAVSQEVISQHELALRDPNHGALVGWVQGPPPIV